MKRHGWLTALAVDNAEKLVPTTTPINDATYTKESVVLTADQSSTKIMPTEEPDT